MFSRPGFVYLPLKNNAPSRDDEETDVSHMYLSPPKTFARYHWFAHGVSLVIMLILLPVWRHHDQVSWASCWDLHNYFSPIGGGIASLPYIEKRFNGSLWNPSPFKGPPSAQTEAAWHSVMQYGMIGVEALDIESVGHNISTASSFPDSAGGKYIAVAVGTHQLHCLHYIWQDHHKSYFEEVQQKIKDIPEMYERHYEHCVDYIRQGIMCNFDAALVTYDWVLDHPNPTPNSNAMHKCVDWDAVQNWLKDKAVAVPEGFVWKQPEGQQSLPWNP